MRLLPLLSLLLLACEVQPDPAPPAAVDDTLPIPPAPAPTAAPTREQREAAVVGQPAGAWQGVRWLDGSPTDLSQGTKLLVFWEAWCPHCKRELPELARLSTDQQGRLEVVGLTRMSRGTTEEQVRALLAESGATFPQGHSDGALSDRFAVTGVPAAALVKDGVVAWRGHPARLDAATLAGLLGDG